MEKQEKSKESTSGGWTTGYLGYVPAGAKVRKLSHVEENPLSNDFAGWPGDSQADS